MDATLLNAAIDAADLSSVQRLLDEAANLVDAVDHAGMTPLMRAVISRRRSAAIVRCLLDRGARVDAPSAAGFTALHLAIDVDDASPDNAAAIIGCLVGRGADLEQRQCYGWTPLLCAVVRGRTREARYLLDLGADPNATFPADTFPAYCAGHSALMAAATAPGGSEMVQILLEAGADPLRLDRTGMNFFQVTAALRSEQRQGRFGDPIERAEAVVRSWTAGRTERTLS